MTKGETFLMGLLNDNFIWWHYELKDHVPKEHSFGMFSTIIRDYITCLKWTM